MARISKGAPVGSLGADTVQTIANVSMAQGLKALGISYVVRYLGALTSPEVDVILGAGLAVMPVTYSRKEGWFPGPDIGKQDGIHAVGNANAAGMPRGTTLWLDLEGPGGHAQDVVDHVTAWAKVVRGAGFDPGLYVGYGTLLTSKELYDLPVDRYWHSMSRVTDSAGQLAEPSCGWCQYQLHPSVMRAGVWVDMNVVQEDYLGRVPLWCIDDGKGK